jgi:hypothetical protein
MVTYECIACDFSSKIKTHYNRHLKTQKHANLADIEDDESYKEPKLQKKEPKKNSKYTFLDKKEPKKNSNYTFLVKKEPKKNRKELTKCQKQPKQLKSAIDSKLFNFHDNQHSCEFCGNPFKTRHIMLKHIRLNCKVKKDISSSMVIITSEHGLDTDKDNEIKELKSQVKDLISKVGNTTINNQTINQQNNVQQNVTLNVFGKEDLSMLTDEIKLQLIKGPFDMMPKLMEMIYFNKEYPQNHTMQLVNKNKDILKIHDKNGWKYVDKDATVDYILEDKNYEVDDFFDMNDTEFSHFIKKTYNDFRKLFDSRDKNLWRKIKKDINVLLWNNMKK